MGTGLLILLGAVVLYLVVVFNGLVRLRMLAHNAYADIDVQLKRRHDLIPSLVAAVQGHAGYEKGTLEAVVNARNSAQRAIGPAAAGAAELALATQVKGLFAIAEAYPDLKAGGSFLELQRSLVEIEDHLQNARRYYNAVVRDLNTRIAQFPAVLVAGPMGFKAEEFFGLENASEGAVPQVKV
ncbi:MAG TPA: LemA family protein [Gemmatimonadales bacterium]|nr:LemA family protein [Gemmatimonadales bacterium]